MIERAIDLYNQGFGKSVTAAEVAIAGDTESDMEAGVRAGVAIVAGVTSGAGTKSQLENSGASIVLNFATELINQF